MGTEREAQAEKDRAYAEVLDKENCHFCDEPIEYKYVIHIAPFCPVDGQLEYGQKVAVEEEWE